MDTSSIHVNICGTGAMACLFGARLSRVATVTLVGSWPDGIEAIRTGGIRLDGTSAMATHVRAAGFDDQIEPAELVLVLVKTWQNQRVAAHLQHLLSPGGVALTLQNGLGNAEALGPDVRVGTTAAGAALTAPGCIRPGGEGPTHAAAPAWIVDLLRRAGFETHQCEEKDIDGIVWGKLVANCGINAVTALLGIRNGELISRVDADWIMGRAAAECAAVARAKGIVLPFDDPVEHTRAVVRQTAANRSSMLQDLLRGAPTEVDAINGAVTCEGRRIGMPTPVNETLLHLVRAAVALIKQRFPHP